MVLAAGAKLMKRAASSQAWAILRTWASLCPGGRGSTCPSRRWRCRRGASSPVWLSQRKSPGWAIARRA
eukprot:7824996-Heterocapsa_arctica.AAC.1